MTKMLNNILIALFSFLIACDINSGGTSTGKNNSAQDTIKKNIPVGLQKLLKAYPDFLDSADENNLYWKDGTVMQYDDGREKPDHETLLNEPDLEDMMKMEYTAGSSWEMPPPENFEPGRVRYEPFFKKMYGNSSGEVQANMVTVSWMPNTVGTALQISAVNGVDKQLEAVSAELDQLSADLKKYVKKTAGTFNWRVIAGTNRMSTHAFGTAIDINTDYSNYWQWEKNIVYKNRIPMEIVEIFERHGFIWGGKWYHYDTMHFEYRPELLVK
jgi:ABC-type cobalt transport system substrate-binding protein